MKWILAAGARGGLVLASVALFAPLASGAIRGDESVGFLDVSSEPSGARIIIDEADVGLRTPQRHMPVKVGHHQLTLATTDGTRKMSMGFSVDSGTTKKLTVYLSK